MIMKIADTTVNIYDAKTNFSKLIARVEKGETVVVAKNGTPVADLTPHQGTAGVTLGLGAGMLRYDDASFARDPEIDDLFYGE